jgi:hypothetical protein
VRVVHGSKAEVQKQDEAIIESLEFDKQLAPFPNG